MVGDQASQPPVAKRPQVPRPVNGVEAGLDQGGGVAKVMQEGGGDQHAAVLAREDPADAAGLPGDTLGMPPSVPQRYKQILGIGRSPRLQLHEPT